MLKKEDKDGIIAYLKDQLQRIVRHEVFDYQRYDPDCQTLYKNVCCQECGEEFEESFEVPADPEASKYIHEDVVDTMKEIAEKALMQVSF